CICLTVSASFCVHVFATTSIYTLSLHDALPILAGFYRNIADLVAVDPATVPWADVLFARDADDLLIDRKEGRVIWRIGTVGGKLDRKSTRLNSSHVKISYAVFCLKKKKYTR